MKIKSSLCLLLLANAANITAGDSTYQFYPNREINRLVYETIEWRPSTTIPGKRDTSEAFISELEVSPNPAFDGMILLARDSGYTRPSIDGSIDDTDTDTCFFISESQMTCKARPEGFIEPDDLFTISPKGFSIDTVYSDFNGSYRKSRYYALSDSIYLFNEYYHAPTPGLPGDQPGLITHYYLQEVGMIYKRQIWDSRGTTTEIFLKQINGISIPKLDTNRVKNGNIIGVIKKRAGPQIIRRSGDAYEKFILNQYLLGRRLGPEKSKMIVADPPIGP